MKATVTESLKNIEAFMRKEHKGLWGMMQGSKPGAIAKILTQDRFYFMMVEVDEDLDKIFLDIHPQCVCEKPYRQMLHGYVNERTSTYKSGRIDVDENSGEVKIRIETQISDHQVSVKDLQDMEHLAVHISDGIERRLDKLCHGVWFSEDDPELVGGMERQRKKLMEKLNKRISHLEDDDASDDEDGEDLSDIDLEDDDKNDDKSDEDSDFPSSFEELMSMLSSMTDSDDEVNPIEAEFSESTPEKITTFRLFLTEVSKEHDTDAIVKTLEQTIGMNHEEALSAIENCPCCIADAVTEADKEAIITQLKELGVQVKAETNQDE